MSGVGPFGTTQKLRVRVASYPCRYCRTAWVYEASYSVTHSGGRPVGTALEKLVKMCLTNTAGLIKSRVVYTHFDI